MEVLGPLGFCSVTWFPSPAGLGVTADSTLEVGALALQRAMGWGWARLSAPRETRPFPSSPSVGSWEAHGGVPSSWAHRLHPGRPVWSPRQDTVPTAGSHLSPVLGAPRPTSPFITAPGSGGAGLPRALAPGVGTPVGAARWVPQGEGSRGSAWRPRSPSPARDRHGDTAFAQKVIQQVLDQIPLFAYKDLFIEPPPPGSASHPCMFGSL